MFNKKGEGGYPTPYQSFCYTYFHSEETTQRPYPRLVTVGDKDHRSVTRITPLRCVRERSQTLSTEVDCIWSGTERVSDFGQNRTHGEECGTLKTKINQDLGSSDDRPFCS